MNKQEFLDTLKTQLQGMLSPTEIEGHLHYYNEYITEAIASGKTEELVLEELGSPVFIAKTLMDSAEAEERSSMGQGAGREYEGRNMEGNYENDQDSQEDLFGGRFRSFHMNTSLAKWVIPVVVILVLFLIMTILGTMVTLVARFFVPIMVIVLVTAIFRSRD